MDFETPRQLSARLRLGREEFCQRLLTSLILHGPYPPWNTRSVPAPSGVTFLRLLYDVSFGDGWPGDDVIFVDEFELARRHDDEMGGAPDYAVLWDDRFWLIELKTERASHRRGQLAGYLDLAHHHFPSARVDLTYVTPDMTATAPSTTSWSRYAHVTWSDIAPLVRRAWPNGESESHAEVIDGVLDAIGRLDESPATWRASFTTAPEPTDLGGPARVERAMQLAELTAADGSQRAVEDHASDLDDLLAFRLDVRERLAATPADSPLRHIMPWIWQVQSGGQPLTAGGADIGMELRLSRYEKALY